MNASGTLLERAELLDELGGLAAAAVAGDGAMVLLSGEAGLGKTAVLGSLAGRVPGRMRTWSGACDPRTTPAPLGPLLDIAEDDLRVRGLLGECAPTQVAPRLLDLLSDPTLVVVEDIHWMDDATADLLCYLARHINRTRSLVVASHRDEPPDSAPALHRMLDAIGSLPDVRLRRLEPLSRHAVARLAEGTTVDPGVLHRRTGGNPFYVTEVLADPDRAVPGTVASAVLVRADRLSPVARELVDLVSLAPKGLETDVAEEILGVEQTRDCLVEATEHGILLDDGGRLRFRHDLAREAIEAAVRPSRMLTARRRLLEVLESRPGTDPSRLAHHAARSGDTARLRRHAPAAARAAIRRGAYRAAVAHLGSVLALGDTVPAAERAELLDLMADAREELETPSEVAAHRMRAAAAWQQVGDPARAAQQIALAAGSHYMSGDVLAAIEALEWADKLVAGMPMGPEVATTVAARLAARVVLDPPAVALDAAEAAVARAEAIDAPRALSKILQCRAVLRIMTGRVEDGIADGWRSIEIAHWSSPHVVPQRTWHLAETLVGAHRATSALEFVRHGLQHAETRDMSGYEVDLRVVNARALLQRGELEEAARTAEAGSKGGWEQSSELMRVVTLGVCLTRLGDSQASAALAEARRLAGDFLHVPVRWPVAAAVAELAWLRGESGVRRQIHDATGAVLGWAAQAEQPWAVGELRYWRWRAGIDDGPLADWIAEPWRLMMAGQWRRAAAAWQGLEAPYERALALLDGDLDAQREALEVLDRVGAVPLADRVRAMLRSAGVEHLPARPRAYGLRLTTRQMEVLSLLADGLTNAQIARRLAISTKTAGHHVSAILERLGVASRTEAVSTAIRAGLLDRRR